ncbi:MAG: carboxypeptidase regulatory-like domain-containing protein [Chitinispirillaceae bacterium]|nr:carboxypeptidase regulatory-like domain-containing protein [Chitinispirillaceae bacterium]
MRTIAMMLILIICTLSYTAANEVRISGTVTDYSLAPVQGAVVKLAGADTRDTTDENGNFMLAADITGTSRTIVKEHLSPLTIRQSHVAFDLPAPAAVKLDLFTTGGRLLQSICDRTLQAGAHRFSLNRRTAESIRILRGRIGGNTFTCKVNAGASFQFVTAAPEHGAVRRPGVMKTAAAVDTASAMDMLEIRHPEFTPQKYLLNPYEDSVVAVSIYAIDANWITELDSMYIDQEVFAAGLDNGNYMAMGQIHSPAGDYDLCFFTLDPTGSVLAENIYGCGENDLGRDFIIQSDNTVRMFGDMWYTRESSGFNLWTMTVSASGDSLSSRIFVDDEEIQGGHGALTSDGGYVIAGQRNFLDTARGNCSVPRVTRIAPDGSVVWTKEYEWPFYYSYNSCIVALSDGGFVLAGYAYDDTLRDYSIWLLKTDENGDMVSNTILRNRQRPWARQLFETDDNRLFLLGREEIDNIQYSTVARFSADCSLEWDTTILDGTVMIQCMTPLDDGSFLMAYNKSVTDNKYGFPDGEAIGIMQMNTDGTVVKEIEPIYHFGHPRSIALGKDNSILISSESGYTFFQQKFFILNIPNAFVE